MPRHPIASTPADDPAAAYHHGDLRRAILEAAVALLSEGKHWDFSLREVARRAGVSHNAPYNHFPDKRALLAAVATHGFNALRAQTEKAAARCPGPEEALVATGAAYVHFGVSNPAQYRLMFGLSLATEEGGLPAELAEAAATAKAVLRQVILEGAQSGRFGLPAEDDGAVDLAVLSAWSLVHGLTTLAIDGQAGEAGRHPRRARDLAELVARSLLDGLRVR